MIKKIGLTITQTLEQRFYWLQNIRQKKFYQLFYITEPHHWAITSVGDNLSEHLNKQGLIKTRVTRNDKGLSHRLVHYGSEHTLINPLSPNNKNLLTWFHFDILSNKNYRVKQNLSKLSVIHTAAKKTADKLIKFGVTKEKIKVIPLGIDLNIYKPVSSKQKQNLRQRLGISDDQIIIGSFQKDGIGWGDGLMPKLIKGPDLFIKTVRQLSQKFPIHVMLTGPARGYIKQALTKSQIAYTYKYCKTNGTTVSYIQACDLCLITSRDEGGPLQFLEALACGIPVVTTNVGLISDIARNEKEALIVSGFQISKLAGAAMLIINRTKLKQSLIKNGFKTIRQYSWENIAKKYYQELYAPLL